MYIDDIILKVDDSVEIERLHGILATEFKIKELGFLKYFLGIETMVRSRKGIFVSQRKYTLDLLKEIGLLGCKSIKTPIDPNLRLGIETIGNNKYWWTS